MVGFRPSPLPGLASSRVRCRRRGGSSVGDDSLSIYRSTIKPISSGWIQSCTRLINPPCSLITSAPARVSHLNIFQTFQKVSLFIFSPLHCLLLPFVSACVCLLFPFCFLFFPFNVSFLTYLFSRLFFLLPHLPFSVHLLSSL